MDKVPVTQEVANAIEDAKSQFALGGFVNFLNGEFTPKRWESKTLEIEFLPYDKDVLLQAMFYGYIIEE